MDRKGEVIKIPKCSSQKNTSQHWLDWVEIFWLKWLEWERGECVGFWWEVVLFYWVSHHTSSLGNTTNHLTGIDLSFPDISRPRDIRKGSQQIRRLTIISSSSLPDRKGGEWVVYKLKFWTHPSEKLLSKYEQYLTFWQGNVTRLLFNHRLLI